MTRAAAIIGLAISTMMAATLFWHISSERGALNQARAQQEELVRHLLQIEQTLSALGRSASVAANPQMPSSVPSAPRDNSTKDAAKADATSADRTVREEALREGNAIVDHALAIGVVTPADFNALGIATRQLSAEERTQMMAQLAAAINADRVQFDKARPSR
jgi:hypothetical protein